MIVLERYQAAAVARNDEESLNAYGELTLALTEPPPDIQPDWDEVAARWLDLIRPVWYERLVRGRGGLLLLKDIRRELGRREDSLGDALIETFRRFPLMPPPDERISACIIGVA